MRNLAEKISVQLVPIIFALLVVAIEWFSFPAIRAVNIPLLVACGITWYLFVLSFYGTMFNKFSEYPRDVAYIITKGILLVSDFLVYAMLTMVLYDNAIPTIVNLSYSSVVFLIHALTFVVFLLMNVMIIMIAEKYFTWKYPEIETA